MSNLNLTLTSNGNNSLSVNGSGSKICNVSAGGLPVGTRGNFKVELKPTVVQNQYIFGTQMIDSTNTSWKYFDKDALTKNVSQSGFRLLYNNNLIVNHGITGYVDPKSHNVVVPGAVARPVTYNNTINVNKDVREVRTDALTQDESYMVRAIPEYNTVQRDLTVSNLVPSIGNDYTYKYRTSFFYVLLQCKTPLAQNAGYSATGDLVHNVPYFITIESIESVLANELMTSRYCEEVDFTQNNPRVDETVYNAVSKALTFNIDPRFKFANSGFSDSITVFCDIQYVKCDDFDRDGMSKISIKKIHQSFAAVPTEKYVVDPDKKLIPVNLNINLIEHEGTNTMIKNDLVYSTGFVDQGLIPVSDNLVNLNVKNVVYSVKDVLVFEKNGLTDKLYSWKPFSNFVVDPETQLCLTTQPQYPNINAFVSVYIASLNKKITLELGLELIGSKLNGHLFKKQTGDQTKYFDFVVKPGNRLVFWDVNHVTEEQVFISEKSLGFTSSVNNNVVTYKMSQAIFNTYNSTPVTDASASTTPPTAWTLTSSVNKNLSFKVSKQGGVLEYTVDKTSFQFDMSNFRNVLKFNMINALSGVDIELKNDKALDGVPDAQNTTYAVIVENTDKCNSERMAICIRQAFVPELWDLRQLDFSGSKDEFSLPNWDV